MLLTDLGTEFTLKNKELPWWSVVKTLPSNAGGADSISGGNGGLVTKSCLTLVTPWTAAHQASLSMGFPRQESWNGSPFAPPRNLPYPRIEPVSPALIGSFLIAAPPGKPTCLLAFNKSGILDTSQHLGFFTQHYNIKSEF